MRYGKRKTVGRTSPPGKILIAAAIFSIVFSLTSGVFSQDTTRVSRDPFRKSEQFYDSVYRKFSRKKFTQMLYDLAFVPPPNPTLPGTEEKIKSESSFLEYRGMVIRNITVQNLDPFGPSILDTTARPLTGIGKALNKAHIVTGKYIIRRNLLFKTGQRLDPNTLAENERILRDLSSIDNAIIFVNQPDSLADTVDITVVTKDVWSIGFDVPVVTPSKIVFRIYDANFLGLGDRFTNTFSFKLDRAPFFMYNGGSYTFTNLFGSFIDANVHYQLDDNGNQNLGGGFSRSFFANQVKFAGGLTFEYNRYVPEQNGNHYPTAFFTDQNFWIGRAYLLKEEKVPTRFIVSGAVYWRNFASAPEVTIDSNKRYYNRVQTLASLAISRNNYYLSDYVMRFGDLENIPYGRILQLTAGPEFTDFYTRMYTGITFAAGDYLDHLGYLSASLKLGGYLYHANMEDMVLKAGIQYMTPLFITPDSKYRFRTFLFGNYLYGFNFRSNNGDYIDLNDYLSIDKTGTDSLFRGIQSLSMNLKTIMYAPWYFYGFRFGMMLHLQGGLVAGQGKDLFRSPFYSGLGFGILIRNFNLIFPTVMISGYFYPNPVPGMPWFQVKFAETASFQLQDFNFTPPHTENILNY